MPKVAVTDYTFPNLDTEREILEPLGATVAEQKKFLGEEKLKELVRDADYRYRQETDVPLNS